MSEKKNNQYFRCLLSIVFVSCCWISSAFAQDGLEHFQPVDNTGSTRFIRVNAATIDGETLDSGDEIAVYDGTLCVGAVKVDTFHVEFYTILRVVLPNTTLPGAIAGNPMLFKVWDKSRDMEVNADPTYSAGGVFGDLFTIVDILEANVSQLTVRTNPPGLSYFIDGQQYTGESTIYCNFGTTYTLLAENIIQGQIRYAFESWRDNGTILTQLPQYNYTAGGSSDTLTVHFTTQYQLAVNSDHGTPSGGGWYDVGASATFSISPTTVPGAAGTQYVFTAWSGVGPGSYTGGDVTRTVTMNNPITENANWKTQYFLTTAENPANGGDILPAPPGAWYDSGSQANVSMQEAPAYEFIGWSGDLQGTTSPASITMDSPKTVTANFGAMIQVNISTNFAGLAFKVDGVSYTTPQTFTWRTGSVHEFSVESPQYESEGTRYVYTSWSDGGAQTHTFTVPGNGTTVIANFKRQHRLTVSSVYGTPGGGGWYDEGAYAILSISPEIVSGGTGIRYVFSSWTGVGTGSYSGTMASYTVVMNNPISETANWGTQYKLTVNSQYGEKDGEGWYDAGTDATFSLSHSVLSGGPGIQHVFQKWVGSGGAEAYTGPDRSHTVTMNHPITEDAQWETQYYLTTVENPDAGGNMTPAPPGGWFKKDTVLTLDAQPANGYIFLNWSGNITGTTEPRDITLSGPMSVTANFGKQAGITIQTSPPGVAFYVDGIRYTTAQTFNWIMGDSHQLLVDTPQDDGQGTRYVFTSWSDGGEAAHTYQVPSADETVTAYFKTQYLLNATSEYGQVTGAGWHDQGTDVTFMVTPTAIPGGAGIRGRFTGWQGSGIGSYTGPDSSRTVTMNNPITETAQWETQYYLGTTVNPVAGGQITLNPNPVEVGSDPDEGWYYKDSTVTLGAIPANGYRFIDWSGHFQTYTADTTITMDGPKDVTANFGRAVEITVQTNPPGLTYTVDGVVYTQTQTFSWTEFTQHNFTMTTPQFANPRTRYVYDGDPVFVYTVPGTSGTYTLDFITQYLLTVVTERGTPLPEDSLWCDSGTDTTFSLTPKTIAMGDTTQYIFLGWNIEGEGFYSKSEPSHTVTMNRPIEVVAEWKALYKLTVVSIHGFATSGGWYDAGTNAAFSVTPTLEHAGTGIRYQFTGWKGFGPTAYTGPDSARTVMMNAPVREVAQWDTLYYLSVVADSAHFGSINLNPAGIMTPAYWNPQGPWYERNTGVTMSGIGAQGYQFQRWSGDIGGIISPTINNTPIIMDRPRWITAHFGKEVQVLVQTDPQDRSFRVDGITYTQPQSFTWIADSVHTIALDTAQMIGNDTRYFYDGVYPYPIPPYQVPWIDYDTLSFHFKLQYKLTVASDYDTPRGDSWYDVGANATFSLDSTYVSGGTGIRYDFVQWVGIGPGSYTGTDSSYTVVMNNPITQNAVWMAQYYLTTNVDPQGSGQITRNPTGFSTPTEWNPQSPWYNNGTVVTLKPIASLGYLFDRWSGAITGRTDSVQIAMNAPKSVTAHFGEEVVIVAGTKPVGLDYMLDGDVYDTTRVFQFPKGSEHYLYTNSPQYVDSTTRHIYTSWSDGGQQGHTIFADTTDTLIANFNKQYALTVVTDSDTSVTWHNENSYGLMSAPSEIMVDEGIQYAFDHWEIDSVFYSDSPTDTVLMDQPILAVAKYKLQYRLTVVSLYDTPLGDGWYDANSEATFEIDSTIVSGGTGIRYEFRGWVGVGDSSYTGPNNPQTVTMYHPITETARWDSLYNLNVTLNPPQNGSVIITPDGTYEPEEWEPQGPWYRIGTTVNVRAIPVLGYGFREWTGDTTGSVNPVNIVMLGPKDITANFGLKVQVRVETDPAGLQFVVNTDTFQVYQIFSWIEGQEHKLHVDDITFANSDTMTRYEFSSWSDGGPATHTYTVPANDDTVKASFNIQHYLMVQSEYGTPQGEGWYDEGEEATFEVLEDTVMSAEAGERFVFTGWDGVGEGSYTGSGRLYMVVMNNPILETARWNKQYKLTVISEFGSPTGDGWYNAGGNATFTMNPTALWINNGTRRFFTQWNWNATSTTDSSHTITMNNPDTVTADWETQFYLSANVNRPGSGNIVRVPVGISQPAYWNPVGPWYRMDTDVKLKAAPAAGYYFSRWGEDATGSVDSVTIKMDEPKSVTAYFGREVKVTVGTNPAGLEYYADGNSYQSDMTFIWYEHSSHPLAVSSPQSMGPGKKYVFNRWDDVENVIYNATYNHIVPADTDSIAVRAQFEIQYLLTITSSHDTPEGAGWYRSGTRATFSIDTLVSGGQGVNYRFKHWEIDNEVFSTNAKDSVTMNRPIAMSAVWDTLYCLYTSTNPANSGMIVRLPSKQRYQGLDDEWYPKNKDVYLTAVEPDDGSYIFTSWSGDVTSTEVTVYVVMTKPYNVIANFQPITHTIDTTVVPPRSGSVEIIPSDPNLWLHNREITLVGKPASRYYFSHWIGPVQEPLNDTTKFVLTTDVTMVAYFDTLDNTPPTVFDFYPPNGAQMVARNNAVAFKVQDDIYGVDPSSLYMRVSNNVVVQDGEDKTGGQVLITPIAKGYHVLYSPPTPFAASTDIAVDIICTDLAHSPNLVHASYGFKTGNSIITLTLMQIVPVTGDTLIDGSGLMVIIPNGALSSPTTIMLGRVDNPPALPENCIPVGSSRYFGPAGLVFLAPVTIRIPITNAEYMNAGVPSLNDLKIYAYSTASAIGVWEDISSTVSWSVENGCTYATFTLNEFGYYCTAAWCQMTAKLETSVSNFPNPFNPDVESFTNIIYTLEANSKVTLTIYDVSGRPVRVLEEDVQRSKAIRYRITWDGRNGEGKFVANNVYFCVLETEDGKRTVRKIAVLR